MQVRGTKKECKSQVTQAIANNALKNTLNTNTVK